MARGALAQEFLAIDAIREDVAILKDGGLRVILMCSSLNLALKSTDEQDAIIYQYQNFLNSLDFPVQFAIHSRRLNIQPYLETLKTRQKDEDNELLKIQIAEYIEFVRTVIEMANVMSKSFFVVVPFTPTIIERTELFSSLRSLLGFGGGETPSREGSFGEYKNQLWQRVDTVIAGLQRFGVRAAPLNTEELVELFYGLYNPTEFERAAGGGEKVGGL